MQNKSVSHQKYVYELNSSNSYIIVYRSLQTAMPVNGDHLEFVTKISANIDTSLVLKCHFSLAKYCAHY